MDSSPINKKWTGSIKEIGSILKSLPEEFKGSIHVALSSGGKAYEVDILVQSDFIIAVSFKEPSAKRTVYGEKAFEEFMAAVTSCDGTFEAASLTDNEFRLVVNANEGALLELIRDLVKTVQEISGEEVIEGMEGWEDLEDEWTDLEKQWKNLEEREKPYREMIMRQEFGTSSIEQLSDSMILKGEVTAHREPMGEESFHQNAREEPAEEIPDEMILEEEEEAPKKQAQPAQELKGAPYGSNAPRESIYQEDSLQDDAKKDIEEISDDVMLKDEADKKEEESPDRIEGRLSAESLKMQESRLLEELRQARASLEAEKKEALNTHTPAQAGPSVARSPLEESLLRAREARILQEVETAREAAAAKPAVKEAAGEPAEKEESREWMDKASSEIQRLKKSVDVYWGWDKKKKRFVGIDGDNPDATVLAQEEIPVGAFTEKGPVTEVKVEVKPEERNPADALQAPLDKGPRLVPEYKKNIGFRDKLKYVTSKQTLVVIAAIDGKKSLEQIEKETSTDKATMKTIIDQLVADGYVAVKTV